MVGDKVLGINEISLRGKTISQANDILSKAGDVVKFLIKRPLPNPGLFSGPVKVGLIQSENIN